MKVIFFLSSIYLHLKALKANQYFFSEREPLTMPPSSWLHFPNKINLIKMVACRLIILILLKKKNLRFDFILTNKISKTLLCLKRPFHWDKLFPGWLWRKGWVQGKRAPPTRAPPSSPMQPCRKAWVRRALPEVGQIHLASAAFFFSLSCVWLRTSLFKSSI